MNMKLIKDSLVKESKYIAEIGGNKFLLWVNALKCCFFYGATPSDWYFYEMYKNNHRENKEIITNKKNRKLDHLFNPSIYASDFDNKVRFNQLYKSFVKRGWIYTKNTTQDEICSFILKYKEVVVKPINLSSGEGIFLYRYSKDSINDFLNIIYKKDFLLEEKIQLIEQLKVLNPDSCQTIRLITIITKNKQVEILTAAIRVGGGKSIVDNFHSKGAAYPIDVKEGVISGLGIDLHKQRYLKHPTTNIIMPGYKIPDWQDVISFVTKAALQNPNARFIGWDVAITPNGCEMIEGNYLVNCNFLQTFEHKGKYNYIKSFK